VFVILCNFLFLKCPSFFKFCLGHGIEVSNFWWDGQSPSSMTSTHCQKWSIPLLMENTLPNLYHTLPISFPAVFRWELHCWLWFPQRLDSSYCWLWFPQRLDSSLTSECHLVVVIDFFSYITKYRISFT
jgi:hypothetical protein